jgi:outer membrane protein OmpA-like peptidoglycan-associated protein
MRHFLLALVLVPVAAAQDFTVQLTTPLSAANNRKGDPVRATVVTPPVYQGDTLAGQITDTKASKGQSIVQFTLTSLLHQGVSVPVAGSVTSVANAQGQPGMDDQNRPFAASNAAPAESQAKSRIGSRLGGMLGGNAGGAISDASNTPSAPPVPSIKIVSQGPGIELKAGAKLELSVQSTGQQSLDSLTPNASSGATTSAPATPSESTPSASNSAASANSGSSAAGGQPELKSTKIEFVPGERTIFFDDFSDMDPDEPPPHWKARNGRLELRTGGGIRELYTGDKGEAVDLTSPKFQLPQNFTFELVWTGKGETVWSFRDQEDHEAIRAMVRGEPDGQTANISISAKEHLGDGTFQVDTSKPVTFALWAQQGRIRAYIDGERLVDANQVEFGPLIALEATIGGYRENGIRSVRLAESAPDFSSSINSGKYITHGIRFDTDGDRLKSESAAVLKQVASGLNKNPNLKLEIDGYTDSVGDAAHNLDLSRRRAQAVMTVLVSQFGIDAGRLTSNGFGAGKPIGTNDTPDGRAQNRRVEFVKR